MHCPITLTITVPGYRAVHHLRNHARVRFEIASIIERVHRLTGEVPDFHVEGEYR